MDRKENNEEIITTANGKKEEHVHNQEKRSRSSRPRDEKEKTKTSGDNGGDCEKHMQGLADN